MADNNGGMDRDKSPVMRYALILITAIVCGIILFSLIPTVGVANTETRTADNEGASDLRFNLVSGRTFQRTYTLNLDNELVITGGSDDITVDMADMIVYADNNLAIMSSGFRFYLIASDYMTPAPSIGQWFTIKSDSNGLKITPGFGATVGTLTLDKPTWSYLPVQGGAYAYFENGTEVRLMPDSVQAVAGIYAGYGAYNELDYTLVTDRTDDSVSVARWDISIEGSTSYTAPEYISSIVPRYNAGDWEYVINEDQTATITGYTGAGGPIVVPATVGGYPVVTVGNAGELINANITSLTISEGIKNIYSFTFRQPEGYTYSGPLVLPDSLEYIGSQAFRLASFTGETGVLTIPRNVGYIGYNAFEGGNYTGLVVESSATPLNDAYLSTSINEVLNLGTAEYARNSYGLGADSVSDNITADGFIANAEYSYKAQRTGVISTLFWLIPLIFLIGLAMYFINRINNRENTLNGGWRK